MLGMDARHNQVDRDFFLRFFQSQGLATMVDLKDVGAFEPSLLPWHIDGSLSQETQLLNREKRSHTGPFGLLLQRLEEKAPSNGISRGKRQPRYQAHSTNLSGQHGWPQGRSQSRSLTNSREILHAQHKDRSRGITKGCMKNWPFGWPLGRGTLKNASSC